MIRIRVTRPIGHVITDSKGNVLEDHRPHWPFPPRPLDYPSLPPDARPVRAPRPPLPAEPAPY